MDTINHDARNFLKAAYARGQPRSRHARAEPFHLSWAFDVVVIFALLITILGCLTA